MFRPRVTRPLALAGLILAACNLAAVAVLRGRPLEFQIFAWTLALAPQAGFLSLAVTRGGPRRFWLGFSLSALAMTVVFLWGDLSPESWLGSAFVQPYLSGLDACYGLLCSLVAEDLYENDSLNTSWMIAACLLSQIVVASLGGLACRRVAMTGRFAWPTPFTTATARPSRFSIGWIMCVIAMVAVDIAIARELARRSEAIAVSIGVVPTRLGPIGFFPAMLYAWGGRGLMVITLEAALLCAMGTSGRARVFWVAFLAGGLVVVLSYLPPLWRQPEYHFVQTAPTAFLAVEDVPGSLTFKVWFAYGGWAYRRLGGQGVLPGVEVLIEFLPLLLFSVTSGLVAARLFRSFGEQAPETQES